MHRWLILLLCWPAVSVAQPVMPRPVMLTGQMSDSPLDIGPFALFYADTSGDTLSASALMNTPFRPFLQQSTDRDPTKQAVSKWLLFTLRNASLNTVLNRWLHVGRHGLIQLYALDSQHRTQLLAVAGGDVPAKAQVSGSLSRMAVPIVLKPGQQRTYLLHVATFQSRDPLQTMLHTRQSYRAFLNEFHQQQLPEFTFYTGLVAYLVLMGLFSTAQYVTNRDIIYAWYSLYIVATCLYFFRIAELYFQLDWWLPNQPFLRLALLPVAQLSIQFFYLLFFGTLLELPRYQPRLWLWYRYLLLVLATLLVVMLICYPTFDGNTLLHAHNSRPANMLIIVLLGSTLALTALALRGQHLLRGYAFTGFLLLLSGAAGTLILNRIGVAHTNVVFTMPSLLFGMGVLLEVFCFSLALGRRTRLIEIEKKEIQQRYAQDLESQLAGRSREIEAQSRLLEAQRVQQLEMEFEQKLVDSEMTALRAQMNPHFIFNCLNSIKLYTLQNDTERASDYLTRFARLIRLVLENSRADRVTLRNELEALQLYSDLEAMRFKHKVRVSIRVDPDIDQQEVTIPPLLLQPYVENAIWHGLMHKMDGGSVTVEVTQPTDERLHVEVTDDGIGRERAALLKSKSAGSHKSFGMQVTADRIRMINELYNTQTQARIFDLIAPGGEALGTKVVLDIPI